MTNAQEQLTAQKTLYLHKDHLGSVETLTDESGAAFEVSKYEPYGGRRYPHSLGMSQTRGNSRVRQGFTGHEHDEEVGLINMKGRMYDPKLGRFLCADPLFVGPRVSQVLNRYSYGLNNPLRYTDPTGFATNELPVIIYDSWYGGSAYAGSNASVGRVEWGRESCNEDGTICTRERFSVSSTQPQEPMSAEFRFFLLRSLYSARNNIGVVIEYGKGALLGGGSQEEFLASDSCLHPRGIRGSSMWDTLLLSSPGAWWTLSGGWWGSLEEEGRRREVVYSPCPESGP
ncbi:RHS repeat-associated core domain-containing protein [Myxococcus sp. K15C18031901]|uniref:RHS repeat domain-containing protein n=1 Tax=Myxococcus dinghuensis TaxID=2906761 RepID=UPI0020A7126B|nr:RHS repeat-associated core domain-containing protein [Myxococcus dinghuensis]MCP3102033.1 RHS repeat-associated core domain-containing protein [Myxococcus dinghuensis]